MEARLDSYTRPSMNLITVSHCHHNCLQQHCDHCHHGNCDHNCHNDYNDHHDHDCHHIMKIMIINGHDHHDHNDNDERNCHNEQEQYYAGPQTLLVVKTTPAPFI